MLRLKFFPATKHRSILGGCGWRSPSSHRFGIAHEKSPDGSRRTVRKLRHQGEGPTSPGASANAKLKPVTGFSFPADTWRHAVWSRPTWPWLIGSKGRTTCPIPQPQRPRQLLNWTVGTSGSGIEYRPPILLHIDHGPPSLVCLLKRLDQSPAALGHRVVCVLALGIGVMNDHSE